MQRQELQLQRQELALQRREFERLADEAEKQGTQLQQTRAAAERDAFITAYDLYGRHLNQAAARIYIHSASGPIHYNTGQNKIRSAYDSAWEAYQQGDTRIFFNRLLATTKRDDVQRFLEEQARYGYRDIFRYCEVARDVVEHATSVDKRMLSLCRRTEWFELLERLEKIIRENEISPQGDV